ncbi:MAG: methylated-DNA-[protein]-cysteine S-methyltransferase [Parcubacteria group bacterium Gr01-1014_56]|nr:MAG: methylated-DNA-[protein]-cysteine S-methyltransferase [Parcubacteria group bacterium Gr01-1014_56]
MQKKPHNFSKRVYAVVAKIPRGKVMTYAQVAAKAGNKGAARAVGTLMAKNYNSKIPCHRVIRSDGKVGNYNRGGPKKKLALLKKEGAL